MHVPAAMNVAAPNIHDTQHGRVNKQRDKHHHNGRLHADHGKIFIPRSRLYSLLGGRHRWHALQVRVPLKGSRVPAVGSVDGKAGRTSGG